MTKPKLPSNIRKKSQLDKTQRRPAIIRSIPTELPIKKSPLNIGNLKENKNPPVALTKKPSKQKKGRKFGLLSMLGLVPIRGDNVNKTQVGAAFGLIPPTKSKKMKNTRKGKNHLSTMIKGKSKMGLKSKGNFINHFASSANGRSLRSSLQSPSEVKSEVSYGNESPKNDNSSDNNSIQNNNTSQVNSLKNNSNNSFSNNVIKNSSKVNSSKNNNSSKNKSPGKLPNQISPKIRPKKTLGKPHKKMVAKKSSKSKKVPNKSPLRAPNKSPPIKVLSKQELNSKTTTNRDVSPINDLEIIAITNTEDIQEKETPKPRGPDLRFYRIQPKPQSPSKSGDRKMHCKSCDITLDNRQNYELHRRKMHPRVIKFVCKICSQDFKNSEGLKTHRTQEHSGENPYRCLRCEETLPTLEDFISHNRRHNGKHPYSCRHCKVSLRFISLENIN